jgi:hypothetical protein
LSYQTEEFYNGIGKFTLIVSPTQANVSNIKNDGILYRPDLKQAMWIRRVSPDTANNRIVVDGYTVNAKLNKRTFATAGGVTSVPADVYTALTSNLRGLTDIVIPTTTALATAYTYQLYGGETLDTIIPILDACDYGNRTVFNTATKKHAFEIYQGQDLTSGSHAVIFSEERGTARALKIENDESVFKNVCYVVGKTTAGAEIVRTVGAATADERHEMWLDSSLTQDSDETLANFQARLDSEGMNALAERVARISFSVTIDESEYGVAFSLGDKVSCVSKRFGVKFNARVTGVKFTQDPARRSLSVTLGKPELDIIGEMKLWQR